jgi:esterase/lipase superfamily enzyme
MTDVEGVSTDWHSRELRRTVRVSRWGFEGAPVLLFPTAGGDAEEIERFHLIAALAPLLRERRIVVYSVDSVPGRAWLSGLHSIEDAAWIQNAFDRFVHREIVPFIRRDRGGHDAEIIAAGASLGAFHAVASICRHPEDFRAAVGLSGTFDPERFVRDGVPLDLYYASPLHFLPAHPEDDVLGCLRGRFVLLATGEGAWENPENSWRMAHVLGSRDVPNRVDPWGADWNHDWSTWRAMLPQYLDELTR